MALEGAYIFKMFAGEDAPGSPYGNGTPQWMVTFGPPHFKIVPMGPAGILITQFFTIKSIH